MMTFRVKCLKIAKFTAENNHAAALIAGCEALGVGANKLKARIELVNAICEIEGCLPPGLSEYRYSLFTMMIRFAKINLDSDNYEAFYGSF